MAHNIIFNIIPSGEWITIGDEYGEGGRRTFFTPAFDILVDTEWIESRGFIFVNNGILRKVVLT